MKREMYVYAGGSLLLNAELEFPVYQVRLE